MSMVGSNLEIPPAMRGKLEQFQRLVWRVKLAEGILAAVFGLTLSYLCVFTSDRFWDTPLALRCLVLILGTAGLGIFFPLTCHRWIWRTRRMDQVARLLRYKFPRLGDQLLGIVELANTSSQQDSHTLIQAAMRQVDEATSGQDFSQAVPNSRRHVWAWAAGIPLTAIVFTLCAVPQAAHNAWLRWLLPWQNTERYTFAQLEDIPSQLVVPAAERFEFSAHLKDRSPWLPATATAQLPHQPQILATRTEQSYLFELPPQKQDADLRLCVGDANTTIAIHPKPRPELTAIEANIQLPQYLQQTELVSRDIRGGSLSLVSGSSVEFIASTNRPLATGWCDDVLQPIVDGRMRTRREVLAESTEKTLKWEDEFGLSAKTPLKLQINVRDDLAPTVYCEEVSDSVILLATKVLKFQIHAVDDFGVQRVGLEWSGGEKTVKNPHPAHGERLIRQGSSTAKELDATATFSAATEGISPQTLALRCYVEDYLPGRARAYSPAITVHILSAADHSIWLTQQMERWLRGSLEVYEQEQRLHDENRALQQLTEEELTESANQERLRQQAAAERLNAQRLQSLTRSGKQLIQQAISNDQFNAETLESWAEMLQRLQNIASQRMPSVADQLATAATHQSTASDSPNKNQASPGNKSTSQSPNSAAAKDAASQTNHGSAKEAQAKPTTPSNRQQPGTGLPTIKDKESDFNKGATAEPKNQSDQKSGQGRIGLPQTVVEGGGPTTPQSPKQTQQQKRHELVDQATEDQAALLTEFEKVRDELQRILGNLEQSTFVKRLKAASRQQMALAIDVHSSLAGSFGSVSSAASSAAADDRLVSRAVAEEKRVSRIQEDLQAYFNRRPDNQLKIVLDDMAKTEVLTKLPALGKSIGDNLKGQSVSIGEFWADTFDRWAEELVGPGCPTGDKKKKPSGGKAGSLPPSVVLEIMKLLEAEVDLREQTRSLQQARDGLSTSKYQQGAIDLSATQLKLHERLERVIEDVQALPTADSLDEELQLFDHVANVMMEVVQILARPETGPEAIAAETEIIELLLQASRNKKPAQNGANGGSKPGQSTAAQQVGSALSRLKLDSLDEEIFVEPRAVQQATGNAGAQVPGEFRHGLDEYFQRYENRMRTERAE